MGVIDNAIRIAVAAHSGQRDKAGKPYILHPLHVMQMLLNAGYDDYVAAAGVLHDVLEDTEWTAVDLVEEGIPVATVSVVGALSKPDGANYEEYMKNILSARDDVIAVKYYDMLHNSDLSRIEHPTQKDYTRNSKYNYWLAKMKMTMNGRAAHKATMT